MLNPMKTLGAGDAFLPDQYGLSQADLRKVLTLALGHGGDYAEIFFEYRITNSIQMEEGIIKESDEHITQGAGVRVLSGDRTGYAYTGDLSVKGLKKSARTAGSVAHARPGVSAVDMVTATPLDLYPTTRLVGDIPLQEKLTLVRRAYRAALRSSPRIQNVRVLLQDDVQHVTIANAEGLLISDVRPMTRLLVFAIAEKGRRREEGYSGGGGRVNAEYFRSERTPEAIAASATAEAMALLEAADAPAGEVPVVLAAGESGVLLHEAVGHLLEADFNRKGTSIFYGKFGRPVADRKITVIDDPTIPHMRGSLNVDDEGVIPHRSVLIENGVLTGYLQDRLSARLLNMSLTGNGRRQDFSCIPIPRMTNTYLAAGEHDPEEILRSVKRGFYAQSYDGGEVEDTGKFTFSVRLGYAIENGKRTRPLKGATLIGTNLNVLRDISMIGHDLAFSLPTGSCGKNGQWVPVMDGTPTVKITRMTVGGRQ